MGNRGNPVTVSLQAEKPAIDRRTLIKGAAVAGAAAWSAPIIIDSLSSPAGALTTGPKGCSAACFNAPPGRATCTPDSTAAACTKPDCLNNTQTAGCVMMSGDCSGGGSWTATVNPACSCLITAYSQKTPPNCNDGGADFIPVEPPAPSVGPISNVGHVAQVCVILQCG
jgi:hypothetical protein